MCGIFGAIIPSGMSTDQKKGLLELGLVSTLRGRDSTGLITLNDITNKKTKKKEQRWFYHRELGPLFNRFPASKEFRSMIDGDTHDESLFAAIGHTRWTTIGEVTVENAHPHIYGNILGVHNGTIGAFKQRAEKEKTSDSRILYEMISKKGLIEALNEAKHGAYALVYVDLEEQKIKIIRNMERTLYYKRGFNDMFFASETRFLDFAKTGLHAQVRPFKPYVLYTIDPDTGEMTEEDLEAKVGKHPPVVVYPRGNTTGNKAASGTGPTGGCASPIDDQKNYADSVSERVARSGNNWQKMYPGLHSMGGADEFGHLDEEPRGKDALTVEYEELVSNQQERIEQARADAGLNGQPPGNNADMRVVGFRGFQGSFLSIKEAKHRLEQEACCNCGLNADIDDVIHWCDAKNYVCDTCLTGSPELLAFIPDPDSPGVRVVNHIKKERNGKCSQSVQTRKSS